MKGTDSDVGVGREWDGTRLGPGSPWEEITGANEWREIHVLALLTALTVTLNIKHYYSNYSIIRDWKY